MEVVSGQRNTFFSEHILAVWLTRDTSVKNDEKKLKENKTEFLK